MSLFYLCWKTLIDTAIVSSRENSPYIFGRGEISFIAGWKKKCPTFRATTIFGGNVRNLSDLIPLETFTRTATSHTRVQVFPHPYENYRVQIISRTEVLRQTFDITYTQTVFMAITLQLRKFISRHIYNTFQILIITYR